MVNQYTLTPAGGVLTRQPREASTKETQNRNSLLSLRASRLFGLLCSLVLLPLGLAVAEPNPPTNLCIEGAADCGVVPTPSAEGIKWHPGHYMQILRGNYDTSQSVRFGYYDQIATNTQIVGVVVPFRWSQLEAAQGDYTAGIALVQAEIDKLESLTVPKRLFIRMNDHNFGGTCPATSHIPQYISDAGGTFETKNGCNWRRWNVTFMGHYLDMLKAYAAELDSEPYFEGIVVLRESPLSFGGSTPPADYSNGAYRVQLDRVMTEVGSAYSKSLVISPTSYVVTRDDTDEHIAHVASIREAPGHLDPSPDCDMWADLTLRGVSGGVDYRGVIPIVYSVEASELGLDSIGPDGGYTPDELTTWANNTQHITHLFWDRNTFAGTSEQQWSSGILPHISDSSNALTRTSCPSVFIQGCDTD